MLLSITQVKKLLKYDILLNYALKEKTIRRFKVIDDIS